MITSEKKLKLKVVEVLALASVLNSLNPIDPLMEYVFVQNITAMKDVVDVFEREKMKAQINNALEVDGALVKDSEGNYEYSKTARQSLEDSLESSKNKEVEITLVTMERNKSFDSLPMNIKTILFGKIVELKEPSEESDKEG